MVIEVNDEMEVMTTTKTGDTSDGCDRLRELSHECLATSAYGHTRSVSRQRVR